MPDEFTNHKSVTTSYVPAINAPIRIDIPEGKNATTNESKARVKREGATGSNDKKILKKEREQI